jgi:hypothetical protein
VVVKVTRPEELARALLRRRLPPVALAAVLFFLLATVACVHVCSSRSDGWPLELSNVR